MRYDERTGKVEGVKGVIVSRHVYKTPTELYVDLPGGKNMVVRASSTMFDQYSSTPTLSVTIKNDLLRATAARQHDNRVRFNDEMNEHLARMRSDDPWTDYSEADK